MSSKLEGGVAYEVTFTPTWTAASHPLDYPAAGLVSGPHFSGVIGASHAASYDLFATPWRTFWQITFPQLLPAIVAGFLLSFTFAFDDYLITTFVNGRGTSTIPLYVFGQIRKGVTPATNAVAAIMLMVTLGILLIGQWLLSRQARKSGGRSGGVASMVAENAAG